MIKLVRKMENKLGFRPKRDKKQSNNFILIEQTIERIVMIQFFQAVS